MNGQMIRMKMSDGEEIGVYHAEAEGARKGGLVLIQEIFGVTAHIRELCDEYAADGYEVLAPALYDREHPGFEAEYTGADFERAVELARDLHPFGQSLDDSETCVAALKEKGRYLPPAIAMADRWHGRWPHAATIWRRQAAIMAA